MLRVTSRNVLVVPPLECAWLSFGDHLEGAASVAKGALLQFDVKGDNDVTVIFKPVPGAKRWQPLARQGAGQGRPDVPAPAPAAIVAAPAGFAGQQVALTVESNYTVILGSHRNSCLKFEKNGETKQLVRGVDGARLDPHTFTSYWINYQPGVITVGSGTPGPSTIAARWVDAEAVIADIQHIGLSSWDSHVSYKGVRLTAPLNLPAPEEAQTTPARGSSTSSAAVMSNDVITSSTTATCSTVPTLFELTSACSVAALAPQNVCGVLAVAALLLPTTAELYRACLGFAARRFREVLSVHGGALWEMSAEVLADVLQESALAVPERVVFDVVALWSSCGLPWSDAAPGGAMEHDSADATSDSSSTSANGQQAQPAGCSRPVQDVEQVLQCIRFVLMSEQELQDVRHHPFSRSHPLVLQLIDQDLAAQASGDAAARSFCLDKRRLIKPADLAASACCHQLRYQRRLAPACAELMYVCDGDRNGVLWYIGAEYGQRQWVNPVLARRVEVRASSPASRYTDPKVIASGQFARTSFAGPRYDGGQPSAWWLVDLGPQHRLLCNYYTMRHDGSSDFARHWVLQGSNDLKSWVDLRRHMNDASIRLPGQYGSWPVVGPAASLPYRAFRVLLSGPTLSATDPWNFCLSSMELYGYFYRDEAASSDSSAASATTAGAGWHVGAVGDGARAPAGSAEAGIAMPCSGVAAGPGQQIALHIVGAGGAAATLPVGA